MSQTIHCQACNADTAVRDIPDLIDAHTNESGQFCCARCGGTDTFLYRNGHAHSRGESDEWIKGVVPIETKTSDTGYVPFVFLTADDPDGKVTGIAFKYYRGGTATVRKRKAARRTGRGPIMAQSQLLALVGRLAKIGVVSSKEWRQLLRAQDA